VIKPGVSPVFLTPPEDLDATLSKYSLERHGYALTVSTLEPRKNLVRVVEAFGRLPEGLGSQHDLALVGPRGWEFDELLARAEGAARVLGHVSENDLAALYQSCQLFCYPSLYEGFGLPLLEAMSAGAPSITSNVSSLPEVGGDAVCYVNPESVDAIAAALTELLDSDAERKRLGELARRRAAEFSWGKTAAETLDRLRSLAR